MGVGWAAGIERILLAQAEEAERAAGGVFVAVAKPERRRDAFRLVKELRDAGWRAEMEHTERSVKGQLKQADRLDVQYTVILGDTTDLKDMASGDQREVDDVVGALE